MLAAYLRLAFADLGRRRLASSLTVLVVAAAAATLTLALSVSRVAERPWERTFAATEGAHVTVTALTADVEVGRAAQLPGVSATTGTVRMAIAAFPLAGKRYGIRLIATTAIPGGVSRPLLVEGSWARSNAIVLERSFARYHGLRVGDSLAVGAAAVEVAGIAVTTRVARYPRSQPGAAFALGETIERAVPGAGAGGGVIGLRLADPADTARAAADVRSLFPPGTVAIEDWRAQRADAVEAAETNRLVLFTFSILMLVAAAAVLATLVGGRALAQVRQLGLLRAIGFSPRQVAALLVLEQLALGLAGAALGIGIAAVVTPAFVQASAALLEAPETSVVDVRIVSIVLATVLVTIVSFTALAAGRGAGRAIGGVLSGAASPTRAAGAAAVAARLGLPLPAVLGARDSIARPGRAALTVLSVGLTVAAVVATLAMESSLRTGARPTAPPTGLPALEWDVVTSEDDAAQLRPLVYGLDAALLALGVSNLLAALLLGLRERTRDIGVLKTIGLTPRQVSAALVSASALLAAAGAAVGIPLGLGLFRAVLEADGSAQDLAYPSLPSLVLLLPATVAVVALIATPIARRVAVIPVSEALRHE